MSYQSKLSAFGDALSAALGSMTNPVPCSHYFHSVTAAPFVIWQEDSDNSQRADNIVQEQAIRGTVDLYSRVEYDPAIDVVQNFLNNYGASWFLNSVQFEDETNLIHHEWVFEVP